MHTFKSLSWPEIEDNFSSSHPMKSLVRHIQETGLAHRLFGGISLDRLLISIYSDISLDAECLHIAFDSVNDTWRFTYFSKPYQKPGFERTYARGAGIEKFDAFVRMIGW